MAQFDKYFMQGLESGADRAFKAWQTSQENSPEALKRKYQAMAEAYGIISPPTDSEGVGGVTVRPPQGDGSINMTADIQAKRALNKMIYDKASMMSDIPETIYRRGGSLTSPTLVQDEMNKIMQDVGVYSTKKQIDTQTKLGEQKITDQIADEKALSNSKKLIRAIELSDAELTKADPEYGKQGFEGWVRRKGLSLETALDMHPETKALQLQIQPMANKIARDIEGGRVTDQDRAIYANAFANTLKHGSDTNARLASTELVNLYEKGGNITEHLSDLFTSKSPLLQKMANQVLEQKPELIGEMFKLHPERFEAVNE